MASPAFEIPSTPLSAAHSASYNVHRIYRPSVTVMLLAPGRSLWVWTLVFLTLTPIVWSICKAYHLDAGLTLGLSLMPLLASVSLAIVAFVFQRFGTRVRFNRDAQRISITGFRRGEGQSYSMTAVRGVQFCDAGVRENTETSWHAYQLNLILGPDEPARLNLLECAGEAKLRAIAQAVADFLEVPLYAGRPAKSETI